MTNELNHWEEEIYQWGKGDDEVGTEVLTALNNIIRGLFTLEGIAGGLADLGGPLNISTDYQHILKEIDKRIDLCDLACDFEVVRTLLFGSKINYQYFADHMAKWGEERKRQWESKG